MSALFWASEKGHADIVQELIARGAAVNASEDKVRRDRGTEG